MPTYLISSDNRVSFAGKTGSGKTFLARELTKSFSRLIAIDPKAQMGSEWRLQPLTQKGLKELKKGNPGRIHIYEPPEIDSDGFPVWDEIFNFVWEIGDLPVYIDEMYSVAKNGRLSYPLRRLYTQGRTRGNGVWASTQRPSFVPLEMFSEAEWSFTFMLRMEEDRKRIARAIGSDLIEEPIRDPHGFYAYYQTWDDPIYMPIFQGKPTLKEMAEKLDDSIPVEVGRQYGNER